MSSRAEFFKLGLTVNVLTTNTSKTYAFPSIRNALSLTSDLHLSLHNNYALEASL